MNIPTPEEVLAAMENHGAARWKETLSAPETLQALPNPAADGPRVSSLMRRMAVRGENGAAQVVEYDND